MRQLDLLWHLVGWATAVYVLHAAVALSPQRVAQSLRTSRVLPVLTFLGLMGGLVAHHYEYQILHPEREDVSASFMLLVLKLSAFSCRAEGLAPPLVAKAFAELPGPLEYYGYVLFFASFLTGPTLPFTQYRAFVLSRGPYAQLPPKRGRIAAALCLQGILYMGLYAVLEPRCAYDLLLTQYAPRGPAVALAYMGAAALVARMRYYGAWRLAEAACTFLGISFYTAPGTDAHGRPTTVWKRHQNIQIRRIEFATSPQGLINNWNTQTASWLRECVYLRLVWTVKHTGMATTTTYAVSALWHGLYPGFWGTFLSGALLTYSGQALRRHLRPYVHAPNGALRSYKRAYALCGWVATLLSIDYCAATFYFKTWDQMYAAFASVYF
ncbi:hypothetical protein CXG81DRAFT_14689, partial [Caulochytrium protostelioides]